MWHPHNPIRHSILPAQWPTADEAARSTLFSPINIGPITLESRTWVPAMVPWRATEDGFVTQHILDWYERFAAGRPGAIVVEATGVRDIASGPLLRIGHDRFIPGLRDLVDTVHRASGGHPKLLIQIIDFLAVKRRPPKDKYFMRFFDLKQHHRETLVEATGDSRMLGASEADVRAFLNEAPDELLDRVLDERELESLRFGYRERVTDMDLAH